MRYEAQRNGNSASGFWVHAKRIALVGSLIATSIGLLACGIGYGGEDAQREQQARDNKILRERYAMVRGTYEGTITNDETGMKPLKAVLLVDVKDEFSQSPSSDGSPVSRPVLEARLKLTELVAETDRLTMTGDYLFDGRLVLTAGGAGPASNGQPSQLQVSGFVSATADDVTQIEIKRSGGRWGWFNGKRVSRDPLAPRLGDEREQNRKYCKIFANLVGNYVSIVSSDESGLVHRVEITVEVRKESGAGGVSSPVRKESGAGGVPSPVLAGVVRVFGLAGRNVFDERMVYDAFNNDFSIAPSSSDIRFNGKWINGVLRGRFGYLNIRGDFAATREPASFDPLSCMDY